MLYGHQIQPTACYDDTGHHNSRFENFMWCYQVQLVKFQGSEHTTLFEIAQITVTR